MMKVAIFVVVLLLVVMLVIEARNAAQVSELRRQVEQLEKRSIEATAEVELAKAVGISAATRTDDRLEPQVGRIQFIGRFTIQLEKVEFRSEGVALGGFVGNPNAFSVSNLTVVVTGHSNPGLGDCSLRDGGMGRGPEIEASWCTGVLVSDVKGQSSPISFIASGERQRFEMLVSGAKASPKDYEYLALEFSGERYGY